MQPLLKLNRTKNNIKCHGCGEWTSSSQPEASRSHQNLSGNARGFSERMREQHLPWPLFPTNMEVDRGLPQKDRFRLPSPSHRQLLSLTAQELLTTKPATGQHNLGASLCWGPFWGDFIWKPLEHHPFWRPRYFETRPYPASCGVVVKEGNRMFARFS